MSDERKYLTAELRRENNSWELDKDCPEEGLMAHALFDELVNTNEIKSITIEETQRKNDLLNRKNEIQEEINDDTQGLKTSLYQQIEQIDDELTEFNDKYDVYDIIPTDENYYVYMNIYEVSWDYSKYAVENEAYTRSAAEEYAKEFVDSEGLDGFSKNFLSDYIDEDSVVNYAREMYTDLIYGDPEGWLDENQKETSKVQDDEISLLEFRMGRINQEIEKFNQLSDKSPEEIKNRIKIKISTLEDLYTNHEYRISEINENPDGEYSDDLISEKIDELVEQTADNPINWLKEWETDFKGYINVDELIEGWIDSDGIEIISLYDGKVGIQKVMSEYYSIIRVE